VCSCARTKQFLAWAGNQDDRTHYFVILIKPSGLLLAEELEEKLKELGFDAGSDLLPENWRAF
jgi:hypothetical protein